MQAPTRHLATTLVAIVVLLVPHVSLAQQATLERVDSLIRTGQTESARALLEQWKKDNRADARSTYFTGRLATRAQDAEDAYLSVALGFPTSAYAAESLLRLGQSSLARGDSKQAVVYLKRLLADYPRSEHRETGEEWLARAQAAAPATTTVIPSSPSPSPSPAHKYTIQVAAFRERAGARSVARQLEGLGLDDVRLVTVPDNALIRVRVGKFESAASAGATMSRIKAAGLNALLMSDAQRETPMRE